MNHFDLHTFYIRLQFWFQSRKRMAWLYKRLDSEKYWIGYRKNGRQFLQSTKTTNKAEAEKKLRHFEMLEQLASDGKLNDAFIEVLTGKKQSAVTLVSASTDFINEAKGATAAATASRYDTVLGAFKAHVNATTEAPLLRDVTADDVRGYLTKRRATTTASTANLEKKILSAFFRWSIKQGISKENPVMAVKSFKDGEKEKQARRAFTLAELNLLYSKAPDDFWRYMLVAGFYTALRLGDLVQLRVGEIDFADSVLRVTTGKTGKTVIVPIRPTLRALLEKIINSIPVNNPGRYLWPAQAEQYQEQGANLFSRDFRNLLLVPAGLAEKRSHGKQKDGRGGKRQLSEVSFHCLRHSFITFLKSTGSNSAVAKELAGHSSDAVNDLYTHIPQSALMEAINKLPEVGA